MDLSHAPLPTAQEARELWNVYGMLDNIRDHSEMVCRVALQLYDWLAESGVELRRDAVETGALLHDISKTACLGTERRHDQEGLALLAELGYPELGSLVASHVFLPPGYPLNETMVVNYADKRVKHDQIVDLDERYQYILERYGRGEDDRIGRINQGLSLAQEVERVIFSALAPKHTPKDISALDFG